MATCDQLALFLHDLCNLPELNVFAETLTFCDDYTGQRLHDNGTQHRANIALRFCNNVKSVA